MIKREVEPSKLNKVFQGEVGKLLKSIKKTIPNIRDRYSGKELVNQTMIVFELLNKIQTEEKKNERLTPSHRQNKDD
jgi:hypothetical protein